LPEDSSDASKIRVQLDGIELLNLKKYANLFSSYRPMSVWSAPEVLRQKKKIQDPLPAMDVYSFAMVMWEIFHE